MAMDRNPDPQMEDSAYSAFVEGVLERLADGRYSHSQAVNALANVIVAARNGSDALLESWVRNPGYLLADDD